MAHSPSRAPAARPATPAPAFTSAVRRGTIGIVGSTAGGGQEVAVRVHDFGGGVSRIAWAAGAQGRNGDAAAEILAGLRALDADPGTEVIVLAVRPVAGSAEARVAAALARCAKPVVACIVGGDAGPALAAATPVARTTKEAALQAVLLTGVREDDIDLHALNWPLIGEVRAKLAPEQRHARALFCAGDLCAETTYLARETRAGVRADVHRDPAARAARLLHEASDPGVGVIALDFVPGDGGVDAVRITLPAIVEARRRAAARGRHLEVLAYVLGTDLDTPAVVDRVRALEDAGATMASSSANAGLLTREFVSKP
jgi:FdrA protein